MKRNKKGFTIVELVIVIAVIGILAAVLIPTFVNLTNKANEASDQSLVKNLNTVLATAEVEPGYKESKTPSDMLNVLIEKGYIGETLIKDQKKSSKTILYALKKNRFLFEENKGTGEFAGLKDEDYWIFSNTVNTAGYSTYLYDENYSAISLEATAGLDVGNNNEFTSVSYSNESAGKEVVIRTNSAATALTIDDASEGTIKHYGSAGALNIIRCHTASYHENGKVAYAEISYGRIVLESGSKIEEIHVNKKENEQAFDTVIIANNAGANELPDRITRDAVTVSEETLVVKVESNGSSENVYVYADGATGKTNKVTEGENKQNENVNSALGQLVLDNGANPGEKAQTAEEKAEAKQEVVNEAIENTEFKGVAISKPGKDTQLMTLEDFRDSVNTGSTYEGYTIKLLDDIDLLEVNWTPIGTSEHPFSGVFDGQNHEIKNFKIRGEGKDVGLALFGFIEGTNNTGVAIFNEDTQLSSFYNTSTYTVYLPSEDVFTCVVKNLNVAKADVNTTANGFTAGVVAQIKNATISNVHLSDSTIESGGKIGGIAGNLSNNYCCFITNCSTAKNVTITANNGNHCTGMLGRIDSDGSKAHAVIANCTNNATINCSGVNGGGIAGQAKGSLFYNDTNNGAVTSGTRAGGIATDCCTSIFIGCTNTGHIKANNTMSGSTASIAGIASYLASTGHNVIVNCQNSGTIEGTCAYSEYGSKIAGIVAGGVNASDTILNNANTGELINHAEGGKVYDICNLSSIAYEVEPADLAALNAATATDNKYIKVTNSISLSDGDTVVVNGQEKLEFVNSPSYLAIDLTNSNANSFVLMVNDTRVTLVNGSGKVVTVSGKGNTVVVEAEQEAEQSIKSLRVSNNDTQVASSLDFAGNADIVLLSGVGLVNAEIKDGATVGRVCFGGTGTFVLTNRGTISHKTEGQYGAEHTIDTITASNITIHNHGTIEAKKNSDDVCSYALLFYGGATVKFYAYEESMVRQEKGTVMAHKDGSIIEFYYEDGTELIYYGSNHEYPDTFKYDKEHVTVTKIY